MSVRWDLVQTKHSALYRPPQRNAWTFRGEKNPTWMNLSFFSQRTLPFSVGPTAVTQPGLCAGTGGAAGQNCVLHALEVMGLWWSRQPAAGRPCRRHWMDRVWTPPPQDTEHWPKAWKKQQKERRAKSRAKWGDQKTEVRGRKSNNDIMQRGGKGWRKQTLHPLRTLPSASLVKTYSNHKLEIKQNQTICCP